MNIKLLSVILLSIGLSACSDSMSTSSPLKVPTGKAGDSSDTGLQATSNDPDFVASNVNLIVARSGYCLTVPGYWKDNLDWLNQYPCQGPSATSAIFDFRKLAENEYQIIAKHSGRCIEVTSNAIAIGSKVGQSDCLGAGAKNQTWSFQKVLQAATPLYQIINSQSGRCLNLSGLETNATNIDADSNNQVPDVKTQIVECKTDQPSQMFLIQAIKPLSFATIGVNLVTTKTGMCMSVAQNSMENNADVVQWPCVAPQARNQVFHLLEHNREGVFSIFTTHSNKCIEVAGVTSTANGSRVAQWECHGQANQKFKISKVGDNRYQIVHPLSNRCIGVKDESNAQEATFELRDCDISKTSQIFAIESR